MRRQRNSRLTRTSTKQNKRQTLVFAIATIILLFILIQFGPHLINLFGTTVYTLRGGDLIDKQEVGKELLQPPTLINIPEATQSARITFEGISPEDKGIIEIYVNDELEDEIELDNKTRFQVKNLLLKKGENTIKARYFIDDKTSSFSPDIKISYITDKPKLEVSFPIDNATFQKADKSITVMGLTDPDSIVTVNTFRAIVDSNGKFTYLLQLNEGENQLNIETKNPAGITSQKSLKVSFHP